jgi:hypothetical protein
LQLSNKVAQSFPKLPLNNGEEIFLEGNMPEIDEEMKETADYAIKSAKDRYKKDLDFSEQSILVVDNILTKIYWGFSGRVDDGGEGGLVYNTALIWGSYLGEYMIFKWGGKWILKGSERIISINNIEFSPIKLVFQKITDHPEYSVEDYINETKRIIYTSVINPQNAQYVSKKSDRFKEQISVKPTKKPIAINRRLVYIVAGILGALIVIAGCITGYSVIRSGGLPAFGILGRVTSTVTETQTQIMMLTATSESTNTPNPTITQLPTYTPQPTNTPIPTFTPSLTFTQIPSSTPTETQTPFIPTNTRRPTLPPTSTPPPPTSTPKPPTAPPPPTNTQPPPPSINSCSVNPSTVNWGEPTPLNFTVQFSAPGYGIEVTNFDPGFPGQDGCSDSNNDGDATASCTGNSGMVAPGTKITVTIQTPLGNCSTSYTAQQ